MPKFAIAVLVFCLLFLQTIYSQKKSDLETQEICGRVKSIEYFSLSFDAHDKRLFNEAEKIKIYLRDNGLY